MLGTAVGAPDKAVNKTDTVLNILRRKAINQKMNKVIEEEFISDRRNLQQAREGGEWLHSGQGF